MSERDNLLDTQSAYREVVVAPLAAGREALAVFLLISLIVALMGGRYLQLAPDGESGEMASFQISDLNLKSQAPVLYRSLLGSAADIITLRELEGCWPDTVLLEEEELPPFAGAFLPAGLRGFVWQVYEGPGVVSYFGTNLETAGSKEDPLKDSFLLRIIDSAAPEHPHPHFGDIDGQSRYDIQVWINPQTVEYPGDSPVERGWMWIVGAGEEKRPVMHK